MKKNLGKIAITPKGVFASNKTYEKLDLVTYEGSSYLSLNNNNTQNVTDAKSWQLIAEKGLNADDPIDKIDIESDRSVNSQAVMNFAIQKINTIAELRKTIGKFEGQVVELLGYYSSEENKNLKYTWTSELITDDGGYIIRTGNNGTWLHEPKEVVKLEDYGVVEGEYIDSEIASVLKYCEIDKIIEFPPTTTEIGFKINSQKNVKGFIKGNNTKLTGDSRQTAYFNLIGDGRISGFVVESKHIAPSGSVPLFVNKRNKTSKVIVDNNNIKGLRISLRGESGVLAQSSMSIVEYNKIDCDFTGFPIYDVQNDIITVYDTKNTYIRFNEIKGKHTNRCMKISSSDESPLSRLMDNIAIHDNTIEMEGLRIADEDYGSKQIVDFYQNTFNISFYNNKVKSRGYTVILENKSTLVFQGIRRFNIYNNEFDIDDVRLYRELGNSGFNVSNVGRCYLTFRENMVFVNGRANSSTLLMSCDNVDFVTIKDNLIEGIGTHQFIQLSNTYKATVKDNLFKNIFLRAIFIPTTNTAVTQSIIGQNVNFDNNYFEYNTPIESVSGIGSIEVRGTGTHVKQLIVNKNTFIKSSNVEKSIYPIYTLENTKINRVILSDNTSENMITPYIGCDDMVNLDLTDVRNTWASLNGTFEIDRVSIPNDGAVSITPTRGTKFFEMVGTGGKIVTVNPARYNNAGSIYYFKNTTSTSCQLIAASGVSFPKSFTIQPYSVVILTTYAKDTYRTIYEALLNKSVAVVDPDLKAIPRAVAPTGITTLEELVDWITLNMVDKINFNTEMLESTRISLKNKLDADRASGQQAIQ